jgi:hypothetical protein
MVKVGLEEPIRLCWSYANGIPAVAANMLDGWRKTFIESAFVHSSSEAHRVPETIYVLLQRTYITVLVHAIATHNSKTCSNRIA